MNIMSIETETMWDVIIIGAGVAGLNAARILCQNNQKVLVLEARSRVGGRIWTLDRSVRGEAVELGAEFVHGVPKEVTELLDPKTDLYQKEGEYLVARAGRLDVEDDYYDRIQTVLKRLSSTIQVDRSFAEFVSRECPDALPKVVELTKNYIEGYHASDVTQISARALATIEKESLETNAVSGALFFRGGQQILVNRLMASMQATLLLGQVVRKINWSPGEVSVHSSSFDGDLKPSVYKGRAVLVTVPLGVLKSTQLEVGAIQFQPELPSWKQEAISLLSMGKAVRITYQFKTPFWEHLNSVPKIAMIFDTARETSLRVWWPRGNLLTGWIGGPQSQVWTDFSERARRFVGVQTISRIFGLPVEHLDSLLETSYAHDWSSDPFSKGVYSYVRVNGFLAPNHLAEPVESTMFFAGEATQWGGYTGTVNGAFLSGQRAAYQILKRSA